MTRLRLLKKVFDDSNDKVYVVVDQKNRKIGFISSKGKNKTKKWGFALIVEEFENGIKHPYKNRREAVDSLIFTRGLEANTESLTIIK